MTAQENDEADLARTLIEVEDFGGPPPGGADKMASMTKPTRELLERALELPRPERERLARKLLESVDEEDQGDELDPAFVKELERRLADKPAPGQRWPTVDEVLSRLRRELKLPARRTSKRRGA